MKSQAIAVVAIALAVSACGKKEGADATPSGAASGTAGEASAAPANAAAPAAGAAPTKEFMVGSWAEQGQCKDMPIEFKADGSMVGPVDKWELNGSELTFVGLPGTMHLTVIDNDTMESRNSNDNKPRKLVRCK